MASTVEIQSWCVVAFASVGPEKHFDRFEWFTAEARASAQGSPVVELREWRFNSDGLLCLSRMGKSRRRG